jgi:hypothetical protein
MHADQDADRGLISRLLSSLIPIRTRAGRTLGRLADLSAALYLWEVKMRDRYLLQAYYDVKTNRLPEINTAHRRTYATRNPGLRISTDFGKSKCPTGLQEG